MRITTHFRRARLPGTMLLTGALLWGCSSSDPTDPVGNGDPAPPANQAPTAAAGPDLDVSVGIGVTLDGTASTDPDGDAITHGWSLTAPSGSTAALDDETAERPSFTPDVEGAYVASLIVNDGTDDSAPDEVTVTATDNTTSSAVTAAAGGSITSADAKLDLTIPAGALAADTEISINLFGETQLPEALDGLPGDLTAYDLGPDGTTFSAPVEVSFDMPGSVSSSAGTVSTSAGLLYAESEGTVEAMANMTFVQDEDDPTSGRLTGEMSHFSSAVFSAADLHYGIEAPATAEVGTPFDVIFTIDITDAGVGDVVSATVEDASQAPVAPDEGFDPELLGAPTLVWVTNSYTCSEVGEGRISVFMRFDSDDEFGSFARINLGKAVTCVEPPPQLETQWIDAAGAWRILPVAGSDTDVTVGGDVRRIDLATGSMVLGGATTDSNPPEWVFALSDGTYLVHRVLGYNVAHYDPNADPEDPPPPSVHSFDQPRHMATVAENVVAVASAFGDLGLISYTPGGGFSDAYRTLGVDGQQQAGTNLQAIWGSADGQTLIGAVTEGDGDAAFNDTQAALLVPNAETGSIEAQVFPGMIDWRLDGDRRHENWLDCGDHVGEPARVVCVFTSGFGNPASEDTENDGFFTIFSVATTGTSTGPVLLDWGGDNARAGGGVFPVDELTTGVAVANQATGQIEVWHIQGSDVTASFSLDVSSQCPDPVDLVLLGDGSRGAVTCSAGGSGAGGVMVIRNLNLQRPPAS